MASHGYIVVAIEHTDGTAIVTTAVNSNPRYFHGKVSVRHRCVIHPSRRIGEPLKKAPGFFSKEDTSAGQQLQSDIQALSELVDGEWDWKKAATGEDFPTPSVTWEQEFR